MNGALPICGGRNVWNTKSFPNGYIHTYLGMMHDPRDQKSTDRVLRTSAERGQAGYTE